jgi:hypothetical protein
MHTLLMAKPQVITNRDSLSQLQFKVSAIRRRSSRLWRPRSHWLGTVKSENQIPSRQPSEFSKASSSNRRF